MTVESAGPFTSILGLPHNLQCYVQAFAFALAAMEPGNDIPANYPYPVRFLMTLQTFAANGPIHGLLMYDRRDAKPDETGIRGPLYFYFGYLCERCQNTFLLPYWAHDKDDLPRAVHHSCHGGLDIDEVPRQQIRELSNEVAVQILDRFFLHEPMLGNKEDRKRGDYLGSLITHRFGMALEVFWQRMVNSAIEKAKGRY